MDKTMNTCTASGTYGQYSFDNLALNIMARDTYLSMKDTPCIPQDIKDAWLEMCIVTTDVENLCNF